MSVFNLANRQMAPEVAKPLLLLVDDDPKSLKLTAMLLADKFEVISAASAKQAMTLLDDLSNDQWIKIAILDKQLPGPGAIALLQQIQHINADTLTILLCAAVCQDNNPSAFDNARIFSVLNKPLDPTLLLQTTSEAMEVYRRRQILLKEVDKMTMEIQVISEELAEKKLQLDRLMDQLSKLGSRAR